MQNVFAGYINTDWEPNASILSHRGTCNVCINVVPEGQVFERENHDMQITYSYRAPADAADFRKHTFEDWKPLFINILF